VKIGDSQGYHADPVVSHDGTRVFFSHHPLQAVVAVLPRLKEVPLSRR
jgi:hypothetical protein